MKIKLRLISLCLCIVYLVGMIPAFASEDPVIYLNEEYDNYITNDTSRTTKVTKGTDGRIVLVNDKTYDKAIYAKAMVSPIKMSTDVSVQDTYFVVSADIMVSGNRGNGAVLGVKSASDTPLIDYKEDGKVTLSNGYPVGSYALDKWYTYTFLINTKKQKFDLYINGERELSSWYLPKEITSVSAVTNTFSKGKNAEFTELYVDNLRVYKGNALLKESAFAHPTPEKSEYPFTPTESYEIGNSVFLNSTGKTGISPSFSPKTGKSEFAPLPGETEPRLYLSRPAGVNTDVFADITLSGAEEIYQYVYEVDVYPAQMASGTSSLLGNFTDYQGSGFNIGRLYSDGRLEIQNVTLGKVPLKKWSTISYVVKCDSQTVDYYLNGELVQKDVSANVSQPQKFRVSLVVGTGAMDMYFDNFRLYEGSEPRDLSAEGGGASFISVAEDKADFKKALGNGMVFMKEKDNLFINDEKLTYSSLSTKPYMKDDVLYIDAETFAKALETQSSFDSASGEITVGDTKSKLDSTSVTVNGEAKELSHTPLLVDGKAYLPVETFASVAFSKFTYNDDRGWVAVTNTNRNFSNSPISTELKENSDIVDRFMQFDRPDGDTLYNALVAKSNKSHPRLLISADEIPVLKERIKSDPVMAKWARNAVSGADSLLKKDPVPYNIPDGLRLFLACLEVRERLYQYSVAYLVTDDTKYADGAWKEIENACNWSDWNVSRHYLDSGKIGPGMAVAYDTFYNVFTDEQKAFMRKKVTEHYLDYTAAAFCGANAHKGMLQNSSNWGSVCNGSVLMWCLATMDEEAPDSEYTTLVKFLGSNALVGLEYVLSALNPSGAWPEGLGYYGYVTEYNSWAALSLRNSCGDDYGIVDYPGYQELANYGLYIQTPAHGYYNYSDGAGIGEAHSTPSEIFAIAKLTDNQALNDLYYNFRFNSIGDNYRVLDLLFYTPGHRGDFNTDYPLDTIFEGQDVLIMKNEWGSRSGTFVGALGGKNGTAEHFDKGSFIYEALGERWAVDLGKDDYNIEGGYYGVDGLDIYRRRTEGHNAVVINPDTSPGQAINSVASIEKFESKPKAAYGIYNLDEVYSENAKNYKRGIYLGDDRNTLTIQDEFTLSKSNSDIYWFMHTKANIKISDDGKSAALTQNGKEVKVEVVTNMTDWHLEARDALPLPETPVRDGQGKNTGITKLTIVGKGSGDIYITTKLIPQEERRNYPGASYTPMSEWTLPDGEIVPLMNITKIMINGNILTGFDPLKTEYTYADFDTSSVPQVTAEATSGNLTIKQADTFGGYALVTLTDGVNTLEYKINIKESLISSLAQSDSDLKVPQGGTVATELTANTMTEGTPAGWHRYKIPRFYAKDAQTGNPVEHLFDDNIATRWASDMDDCDVIADLGEVKDLAGVSFVFYDGANRNYVFDLQVSEDGINYKTVYTGQSIKGKQDYETLMLNTRARYIRYVGHGHTGDVWNNMIELAPFYIE